MGAAGEGDLSICSAAGVEGEPCRLDEGAGAAEVVAGGAAAAAAEGEGEEKEAGAGAARWWFANAEA